MRYTRLIFKLIFFLNESQSPFLSLATKTPNFYRETSMHWREKREQGYEVDTHPWCCGLEEPGQVPGSRWDGGWDQKTHRVWHGQGDYQSRYFTLLMPIAKHMTLEFGQEDAFSRTLRHFPEKCLFCEITRELMYVCRGGASWEVLPCITPPHTHTSTSVSHSHS